MIFIWSRVTVRQLGLFAGDVYFDIMSIGERYGKFRGAADSQPEPGELSNVKILKCEVFQVSEMVFDLWWDY